MPLGESLLDSGADTTSDLSTSYDLTISSLWFTIGRFYIREVVTFSLLFDALITRRFNAKGRALALVLLLLLPWSPGAQSVAIRPALDLDVAALSQSSDQGT